MLIALLLSYSKRFLTSQLISRAKETEKPRLFIVYLFSHSLPGRQQRGKNFNLKFNQDLCSFCENALNAIPLVEHPVRIRSDIERHGAREYDARKTSYDKQNVLKEIRYDSTKPYDTIQ